MIQLLVNNNYEKKLLPWAAKGLPIFLFAFLWAPSRDALQIIYLLTFFLPMLLILLSRKPHFIEYGAWATTIALCYAGFSTISALWGTSPKDFCFFILQWCVLATWLCGSCLIFSKYEINVEKYLRWMVVFGILIIAITFIYNFLFTTAYIPMQARLVGWNIFRNPNEIGAFCGIIALVGFVIGLQSSSLKEACIFYTLALIASISLLASISRGALVALAIMSFIAFIIKRPPLKIWLSLLIIVIIALLMLVNKTNVYVFYTSGRLEGFGFRFNIWSEVFERCKEHILLGIGMTKNSNIMLSGGNEFNHAHNAWLDTLYRVGLIGLILVLIQLIKVIQKFSSSSQMLPLYMWLGYGCICNLVDGRCFFWEISAKWFLYWIPMGLIIAAKTGNAVRKTKFNIKPNE